MKCKKIISVILAVCVVFSCFAGLEIVSSAAQILGEQTYTKSIIGPNQHCAIDFKLKKANIVSDDTVTYIVDRYYHTDMSSYGNIYSVNFIVKALAASSEIKCDGFTVSDKAYRNAEKYSDTTENLFLSAETSGNLIGEVPAAGESKEATLKANLTVMYYNGTNNVLDDCSASAKIKVVGIDTTELRQLINKSESKISSCWTNATWSAFSTAFAEAKSVLQNPTAIQKDIDEAYTNLSNAEKFLTHNGPITSCEHCINGGEGVELLPTKYTNISYGADSTRNIFDLYLPANVEGDISLILFIHGGAWFYGSKESFSEEAYNACAKYGVATASINYRYISLGSVTIFDILDDIEAAVSKIKSFAAEKGLNIKKMMLHGFSAGAHLSLMYAYTRDTVSEITPVCVYSNSGPTYLYNSTYMNINGMEAVLSAACGKSFTAATRKYAANELIAISPLNYVDSNCVPTIICHGTLDSIVPYNDAQYLDNFLTDAGVKHEFFTFPNSDHGCGNDPDVAQLADKAYDEYVEEYLLDIKPEEVHNYETIVTEKTCTTDGYTTYVCKDCGKNYIGDIVKAGHIAGDWEVVTLPTYEAEGKKIKTCSECSEVVETETIAKLEMVFRAKKDSCVELDEENKLILNVPQGESNLDEYVEALGCEIEYVKTSEGFGTGTLVNVIFNGEVVDTYTIVVSGDTTGDGFVDAFDVSIATYYINTFSEPDKKAYFASIDALADGVLDATDLAVIINIANHI